MADAKHTVGFTPGPWEYVPSNEHHGPYITTAADGTFGDIADCYAMSDPSAASIRNGGSSRPIYHQSERADANARLIAAAPDLLEALLAADEADRLDVEHQELIDRAAAEGWDEQTGGSHLSSARTEVSLAYARAREMRRTALSHARATGEG